MLRASVQGLVYTPLSLAFLDLSAGALRRRPSQRDWARGARESLCVRPYCCITFHFQLSTIGAAWKQQSLDSAGCVLVADLWNHEHAIWTRASSLNNSSCSHLDPRRTAGAGAWRRPGRRIGVYLWD